MKITCVMFCAMLALATKPVWGSEDPYSLTLARELLKHPHVFTSIVEKEVHRQGDRLAIGFAKILGDKDMRTPQTVRVVLRGLREAFAYPQLITQEEDKKPQVSLLLLRYLEQNSDDPELKKDIGEAIGFIREKSGS